MKQLTLTAVGFDRFFKVTRRTTFRPGWSARSAAGVVRDDQAAAVSAISGDLRSPETMLIYS
jgi:hypothetical protein